MNARLHRQRKHVIHAKATDSHRHMPAFLSAHLGMIEKANGHAQRCAARTK